MEKQYIAHTSTSIRKYRSPGPAAYNTREVFGDVTAIKMKGRRPQKQDLTNAPYLNLPSSFGKVPAIRIGPLTKTKDKYVTPGPTYVPPPFGSDARKISFHSLDNRAKPGGGSETSRRKRKHQTSPGPADYNTRDTTFDTRRHKRGIKIKGHHDFNYNTGCSPGPAYSIKTSYDSTKPSAQKTIIHTKSEPKKDVIAPAYRNLGSTLGGPKFTMKGRANDEIFLV